MRLLRFMKINLQGHETMQQKIHFIWKKGIKTAQNNKISEYLHWNYIYMQTKLDSCSFIDRFWANGVMNELSDVEGTLKKTEWNWLYNRARKLPDGSAIIEMGSEAGQSTCCFALSCLENNKHVYSIWNSSVLDLNNYESKTYISWHQNIIRKFLVPVVTPVLSDNLVHLNNVQRISLLYINEYAESSPLQKKIDEIVKHVSKGCMVIFHQKQLNGKQTSISLSQLNLDRCGTFGTLKYGFVDK